MAPVVNAADDEPPAAPIGTNEIPTLQSHLHQLVGSVSLLQSAYRAMVPEEPDNVLAITAPRDVTDLDSFERFISDVKMSVERSTLLLVGDKPALFGVDRGSVVMILSMGAAVALVTRALIAVCDYALAEKRRVAETQKHLEMMGLLNEELVASMNLQQREYRKTLAAWLDAGFEDQHPAGHNAYEATQNLLNSMETMMGLIERGAALQLRAADAAEDKKTAELIAKLPDMATKLLGTGGASD